MTIIGTAYVDIRAVDTNLRRDIDNAMKKIKDVTINLQADVNLTPVRKKISDLRAELKANPLKFQTEVDDSRIVRSLAEAHQLYEDNPLHVQAETDTSQMETALQTIHDRYGHLDTHVSANANTARAETQLAALTRRRSVDVSARFRMDPQIAKALNGLKYTMLGAVPAPAIKSAIAGVLGNLEQLSVASAKVATIVGSASAAVLTLGANALSIVGDIGSLASGMAVLPAALSGVAVSLVATKIAWKGFFGAFSSDAKKAEKAMKGLPTEAQDAVRSMKGLWGQITRPAQKAFWVEMGTALQDTVKTMIPSLKKGFSDVEVSLAKMTKGGLNSFKKLAQSGGMGTLFDNIAKGVANASRGVEPFFDAINRLSVTGSKWLPVFGDSLTKAANRFNDFITKADKAGKVDVWIATAKENLKSIGGILSSSGSIIKGFTTISDMSGGKGLNDMADGMKRIASFVNGEPFRSRLVFVLEGARVGAEALGTGFGKLMGLVGRSTIALRHFVKTAGEIAGVFFNNLSKMFDGTGLGDGFTLFIGNVKDAMTALEPTFVNMGKLIGDMGEIFGIVLVNMVPGLNNLFETLQSVMAELKDGMVAVIPILNEFVQGILVVAAPIAIAFADAIGNILTAFAGLPEILRNAILGFGLFLIILAKVRKMLQDTANGGVSPLRKRLNSVRDSFNGIRSAAAATMAPVKDAFATTGVAAGYARDAVKKSFGSIRDSVKLTAMYVADGFKKSLSQLGEAFSTKIAGPLKSFSTMMKAAWKEALMPTEVREGFKRVGQNLADVARIYTGYVTQAKNSLVGLGKAIASALPMGLLGPALKALPGEIGKAFAFGVQKAAIGVANMAKIIAGPQVGFAVEKMKEVISTRALYASKRLEDIGKGIGSAVSAIQKAPAAVGGALSKLGSSVSNAFSNMQSAGAKAFNSAVLAAAIHPMTAPFVTLADSARTATLTAAGHVSNMATAVGRSINTMTVPARTAFAGMAVAASIHSGIMADKFKVAADRIGGNIGTAFRNAGRDLATVGANTTAAFSRAFQGVATAATTTASAVSSTFQRAASNLKANFAPAASAIRETFSSIGQITGPARTALGELGSSARGALGSLGAAAGTGLRGAASGLLGALGGPWGLAIGAATAGLTMYAQALSDSKQKVDSLASSLEQTSGAVTGATKNLLANNALDGATDKWDDFWRGVMQGSKATDEILGKLGTSTKDYIDKLADPAGRDAYVQGLRDISQAMNNGLPVTEEMAKAIGTTKEALKGVNGNDMGHLAEKAGNAASELARAEKKVQDIAKATGTSNVQAKIMAKNFDTLKDSASSASQKFSALKENLDLLNRSSATNANGTKTSVDAAKAYQQSLQDTKDAIQGVRDKNDGLVKNLFSVKQGFDFTSQAGRDLHTALSTQKDAILQLGAEAMDKALKGGADLKTAQKAAMESMGPAIESFKQSLSDMGFGKKEIEGIITTLGLVPKNVTTALGVEGSTQAQLEIMRTTTMAAAFQSGNYKAVLSVLPDAAKQEIERATGLAGAFAKGDYDAILKALDKTKGGRESALFEMMQVANGKYEGKITAKDGTKLGTDAAKGTIRTVEGKTVQIKAFDNTMPGVNAAGLHIKNVTDKNYHALIEARYNGANDPSIIGALNALSANRIVSITPVFGKPQGTIARPGDPLSRNGSIIKDTMNPFRGNFAPERAKYFANGGVENHVAQIAKGATPYRVWAEPETGGEAYIPLGKSKRARSMKILEEVAKMFGMSLIKIKGFANGGTVGGSSSPSSTSTSLPTSGNVPAALLKSITQSLLKDNNGLNNIGQNIVDGIIGGVNNKRGAAVTAMKVLSNDLEQTVRTELDIHSPSKAFLALGKYIVDGLSVGIKANAGTTIKNMATLANRLYVAASDVAKATGRSVNSSLNLINTQKRLNVAWSKMPSWKYTDQIVDYYQKTGRTGNRTLADIVRARDDVSSRLNTANARLKSQTAAYGDVVKDVESKMKGEFKLGSNILTDQTAYVPEMRFSDVKTYATGVLSRLRSFNGKLQALRKKGVAPALINEVAQLGSAEGSAMADALLSGSNTQIKGLNSDVAAISSISHSIGVSTADGMYKAGLDATRGLIAGLTKDQASLTRAANQISSTLIRQVKNNLGIRSPSRVFAELGRYTTQGYIVGLDQMQPKLDTRMDSLINTTPRRPNLNIKAGATTTAPAGANAVSPATAPAVIQVLPSAGMDEVAVGQAAVRELNWQMLSR